MRIAAFLATTLLAMSATAAARADTSPQVDWMRVLVDLNFIAKRGVDAFEMPRCNESGSCYAQAPAFVPRSLEPNVQNAGNAWFGVAPRVSLVARDWGNAYKVAGDRLALVDAMRLTSSTRMVVSRVRLSDRRFTPFAQLGLGQWRVDPYLLPAAPHQMEIAAQVGGGVELAILPNWQMAAETSATVIYRDDVQPADSALPRMWSTMFASRLDF